MMNSFTKESKSSSQFSLYKYFERENAKSKYRGPLKLTFKTEVATGYSERTVKRIVTKKSDISVTVFTSPAKCYTVERKKIVFRYGSSATTCARFLPREKVPYVGFFAGCSWCGLGPSVYFVLMPTGETLQ